MYIKSAHYIDLSARAGVSSGEAVALNDHGDAIGANGGLGGTPVLWRADGSVVTLETLGSGGSYAWSINDATQIVGWSQPPITGLPLPADHAVIWNSAGQLTDINPAGFASSHAYDISNSGWIVGSCSDSKTSYAVVWMPVPEPGSLCSLASGVVALAMVRRSRRLSFARRR